MRAPIIALVTALALLTTAIAGPRTALVLPLDGNASAARKAQLNESLGKLAKEHFDGDTTIGDATFAETAAAVGCDATTPECVETVRSTLAVDELVYGTADSADGATTVTVYRAAKDTPPSSQIAVITDTAPRDQAESGLARVFTGGASGSDHANGAGPAVDDGSALDTPRPTSNFLATRERKIGVGLGAGAVISLAIGISLWASKSDLQDQIDNHPTRTLPQLTELRDLEDRAASKALWGNVMVGLGLGLGAASAYFLFIKKTDTTTVTPAPVDTGSGMTLVLRHRW